MAISKSLRPPSVPKLVASTCLVFFSLLLVTPETWVLTLQQFSFAFMLIPSYIMGIKIALGKGDTGLGRDRMLGMK